ncbi:MAG: cbb3-type cytochrome c oxidase subunit 3 [Burkholderiaceae bacterium]
MNPIWGPIAGAFIVLMMVVFIGIWIWAWLPYHKRDFGALARLPMTDEDGDDSADIGTGERR